MHAMTFATVTSDNAAHGYNLTFAFPMILFIVIAGGLYLLYSRPHRVPGHGDLSAVGPGPAVPEADPARAAAAASGFTTAAGGGAAESVHEAAGAHRAASTDEGSGNVSLDENLAAADGPQPDKPSTAENPSAENREAGE